MSAVFALAIAAVALSSVSAQADDFTFSFVNTVGNVGGTVTGEILGLTNNSTGPATEVLITSFPSGLNSVLGSAPINATDFTSQVSNSFTETNGQVTAADFIAWETVDSYTYGGELYVDGDPYNYLNLDGTDAYYVYGNSGLAAANIQPLVAAEPSSLLLLATGLIGLLGLGRRKLAL